MRYRYCNRGRSRFIMRGTFRLLPLRQRFAVCRKKSQTAFSFAISHAMSKSARHYEHFYRRLGWEEIDPQFLRPIIELARREDLSDAGLRMHGAKPGDATTQALFAGTQSGIRSRAHLTARRAITVCGLGLCEHILPAYGTGGRFTAAKKDGERVLPGERLGTLEGSPALLITAERVLLNFLQHLSGVATHTRRHVDALGQSDTRLLDTRKTTPGFRLLEKYAVACGGGWNHRLGLYDRIMIKDNHLAALGATAQERLRNAVALARSKRPDLSVQVEVDSIEQIEPVIEAGADIILLDNFSVPQLQEALTLIDGRCLTEASGGVNIESLPQLGQLGLDFISCGALIHQAPWVDIGLDWE